MTFTGTGMGTVTCRNLAVKRGYYQEGGLSHRGGQAVGGTGGRINCIFYRSLWWAVRGHTSELSVQPRGSLAASLAFLLGSLDPGPGGTAAHGALSLAPDFLLTASHGLQTHPSLFFRSSGSGLSLALPHLLHSSPGAGSLLPKPQLPTQLSRIRTSPSLLPSASPPHRTPVVGLRLALSHFPIDDSWIRRGEAPAARAGGEFVARAPPWPHSVLRSS